MKAQRVVIPVLGAVATLLIVGRVAGGDDASATPVAGPRVAMVTDASGLNDRGFNHLAYVGLQHAQRRLGAQIQVAQSRSPADYIPNLASFARRNFDLVVGVGYNEIAAVDAVAKRFPNTHFAIVDVSNADLAGHPKNVLGLLFREEQVGYLAGYLAGLEAKRLPGKDVVSSVAGEKQPPVDRFIAGYRAGAKKADPRIQTLNAYSQDFTDPSKCKALALNQIAAGSIAVFSVAGDCGLGALDAAKEQKAWGIGVDADQSFLGAHILTSATKKVDRAVFLAIKSVAEGTFHGGDAVYGLDRGGVGLGKISAKVPRNELAAVARIQREILAGRIRPPRALPG
jgi:basic membrane protein A and related proteins